MPFPTGPYLTLVEHRWYETTDQYRRGHHDGTSWVSWADRGGDPVSDDWAHPDPRWLNHIFFFIPRPRSIRKNGQMALKIRHSGTNRLKRFRFRFRETTEWRLSGSFSESLRREFEYYAKQESKFRLNNTYMDTPFNQDVTLVTMTSDPGTVASDIGKPVLDDGGSIGRLLYYDNTTFEWWVAYDNDPVVATGSAMTISGGTGSGTSTGTSENYSDYDTNIPSGGTEVVFVVIKSYNFAGSEGRMIFGDVDVDSEKTTSERMVDYEIVLERVSAYQVEGYGGYP
jgi:hypothetical protein